MPDTTKTKKLAPDGWDEEKAIADGYYFVDMFGVKHGIRTPSPDPSIAANPIAQDEKDAQAALDVANEKREAALVALQEGMRSDGTPVQDYSTGSIFYVFGKRRSTPATLTELKAAFKEAEEDAQRARVKLQRAQDRRAERIRLYNVALIKDTPLQIAIREAQRNGVDLTEEAARKLATPPVMVSPGRRSSS